MSRFAPDKEHAKKFLANVLKDTTSKPFYDTLITDKETVISVAEPILFKIYGKENIVKQQPYVTYLIDGYWYVGGTLPESFEHGGTFEMIVNARNCEVLKIVHGK